MDPKVVPILFGDSGGGVLNPLPADPYGQRPIAVDQPNTGSAYPFLLPTQLNQVVADFYLRYPDPNCEHPTPFYLAHLDPTGPRFELVVRDADDEIVLNTTSLPHFSTQAWGSRLLVLQWWDDDETVCRIVQHVASSPEEEAETLVDALDITPEQGRLVQRVMERAGPRVRSIRIEGGTAVVGSPVFRGGYNTQLTLTEAIEDNTGSRLLQTLLVTAAPGGGIGKYGADCEETSDALKRFGGATADTNGNLTLDAGECLRIERPVVAELGLEPREVSVEAHTLKLHNDCDPCCNCEDYAAVFEAIRQLRDGLATRIAQLQAIRDQHLINVTRWNVQKDCRDNTPLRVVLRPRCPDELAIAVAFCNTSSECLENVVIPLSFAYSDTAGDIDPVTGVGFEATTQFSGETTPYELCGSTEVSGEASPNANLGDNFESPQPYKLGGAWPHFFATWSKVQPGAKAEVQARLIFDDSIQGDYVQIVTDAYSTLPGPGGLETEPIPGYTFGAGPQTQAARDLRIAQGPVKKTAVLLQDCCGDVTGDLDVVVQITTSATGTVTAG